MASAWSSSWGNSWGISWGGVAVSVEISGGHFYPLKKRKPSKRVEEETEERLKLERTIAEIYDRMQGIEPEVAEEVANIVAPAVKRLATKQYQMPVLDYQTLLSDMRAVNRLMEMHAAIVAETTEEEELFMMIAAVA